MKVAQTQGLSKEVTPNTHQALLPSKGQKPNESKADLYEGDVISTDKIQNAVTKMNEFTKPLQTDLRFQLHEDLNEYYVTVVDPLTDEVIKEIPPKKMLDMYAAMAEFMGLMVDERI
ncbi:flagellar protein FlaG [Lentibacillus saliphilus]|uniref:flagellar protein FlaG n=1 Tax=Lentibacillus saliphilus TaxID=2737028 RepID=UPI001C30EAAD|nr:flagellar protein FlaG [Lentibacillus saliphilus]